MRTVALIICLFLSCKAAVNFDGIDDAINLDHDVSQNLTLNGHSLAFWVRVNGSAGAHRDLVSKDGENVGTREWLVTASSVNRFRAHVWNNADAASSFDGVTPVVLGTWYHVAQTWDATSLRLYVDGVLDNNGAAAITPKNTTQPVRIAGGALPGALQAQSPCDLEDIRIYNRALSGTEVATLYSSRSQRVGGTLANGLIAHFELNDKAIGEVAAQILDSSANLNHAGLVNFNGIELFFTNDVPTNIGNGASLEFDGSDDYVFVKNSRVVENIGTEAFWLYLDSVGTSNGHPNIYHAGVSSYLAVDGANNQLQFWNGNWQNFTATNILPGSWNHVAFRHEPGDVRIYVNGLQSGSLPLNTGDVTAQSEFVFGGRSSFPSLGLDGKLDDFRVYDRALTNGEISYLYNGSGMDPGTANLQALWTFDEEFSFAKDISGNNNHGKGFGGDSMRYSAGPTNRY